MKILLYLQLTSLSPGTRQVARILSWLVRILIKKWFRTSPTLSCSAADRDPLQNLDVSTSFGFLQVLLDVQQQDLHCVNSVLDVRDTVQDGERSSDVFTEQ